LQNIWSVALLSRIILFCKFELKEFRKYHYNFSWYTT
jgi:hypothetical protein